MATFGQLAQSMNNMAVRVEKGGPAMQRLVALEILRLVISGTPVGNKEIWMEPGKARVGYVGGRARANWFVGIGQAVAHTTEAVDASGGSTLQSGKSQIEGSAPGVEIHLSNNLPYIVPLNRGHSHQAPEGWIERAIAAGLGILANKHITDGGK